MDPLWLVSLLGAAFIGWIVSRPYWRAYRRRRAARQAFPVHWQTQLSRHMALYEYLPEHLRPRLHARVLELLEHFHFVGCAGLELTDTMRLVIAGHAGLLVLQRNTPAYEEVREILVYPDAFFVEHEHIDESGVRGRHRRLLSGEAWGEHRVVVSWRDARAGAELAHDGENVVLHEFAHVLDEESGEVNGAPHLPGRGQRRRWRAAFSAAYAHLQQVLEQGGEPVLDPYAATAPEEFFAVATETFFEQPRALRQEYPALYDALAEYYCLRPAEWRRSPGADDAAP